MQSSFDVTISVDNERRHCIQVYSIDHKMTLFCSSLYAFESLATMSHQLVGILLLLSRPKKCHCGETALGS